MNTNCTICGAPHNGSGIGTGDGLAHRWCYEREHPPRELATMYEVARGCVDPILAAEVVAEMVPYELADAIVVEFNKRMAVLHKRRCVP